MTDTLYKNGGLIVNEREDGDIELINKDTEQKVFLSNSELMQIFKLATTEENLVLIELMDYMLGERAETFEEDLRSLLQDYEADAKVLDQMTGNEMTVEG